MIPQTSNVTPIRTPLKTVKPAVIEGPWRLLVYGTPGIGKTTIAAKMPAPIFICAERSGADEHDVARWPDPILTWANLLEAVERLTTEEHSFESLVIDMIDDIEPLCWAAVVKRDPKGAKTIEEACGGYAKGYNAALDDWREFAAAVERLQEKRGMHVVLVAHAVRRELKNPVGDNYERWEPNVHKKAAGFLVGWCKDVLFCEEEVSTYKAEGAKKATAKAVSTGARVIRSKFNPAYDAKTRHGLPDPLPLSYEALAEAMVLRQPATPLELQLSISVKVEQLADPELKSKIEKHMKTIGDNATELAIVDNRLSALISERANKQEQANV